MHKNITDIKQVLNDETDEKHFSFEVLPPLKVMEQHLFSAILISLRSLIRAS